MAQKFLTNLDLNQNQLINATFEKLGVDPSSGNFEGRLIYNTATDTIKVYTGAAFKSIPHTFVSGGGAGIAEALTVSESNGTVTHPKCGRHRQRWSIASSDVADAHRCNLRCNSKQTRQA